MQVSTSTRSQWVFSLSQIHVNICCHLGFLLLLLCFLLLCFNFVCFDFCLRKFGLKGKSDLRLNLKVVLIFIYVCLWMLDFFFVLCITNILWGYDACVLILHPTNMLKVFTGFKSFLVVSLGYLSGISHHLQIKMFCFFHSCFIPFSPSLTLLIDLAQTSSTKLNKTEVVWGEHSCFITDFSGDALTFSTFKIMLAVVFLYNIFIM